MMPLLGSAPGPIGLQPVALPGSAPESTGHEPLDYQVKPVNLWGSIEPLELPGSAPELVGLGPGFSPWIYWAPAFGLTWFSYWVEAPGLTRFSP